MTFGEGNGRARTKRLITVFAEAMSRVASRHSRVSQAIGDDTKADGANKSHLRNQKEKTHPRGVFFFLSVVVALCTMTFEVVSDLRANNLRPK